MDSNSPREFYVEKIDISSNTSVHSGRVFIKLYLNAYNNGRDYYQIERLLEKCFKTKEDLIKSL